jgi:hypothetical protein
MKNYRPVHLNTNFIKLPQITKELHIISNSHIHAARINAIFTWRSYTSCSKVIIKINSNRVTVPKAAEDITIMIYLSPSELRK